MSYINDFLTFTKIFLNMPIKLKLAYLSLFVFLFITNKAIAQKSTEKQYYIEIKNINTKEVAKQVELLIKSKTNVTFFSGYKIPVTFHLLKSNKEISKTEFENWLKPLNLTLSVFEEKVITASFILSKKRGRDKYANETKK